MSKLLGYAAVIGVFIVLWKNIKNVKAENINVIDNE